MSIEDKFNAAVRLIKSLPADGPYQPSNDAKLKCYSLYKQATEGPCKVPKPGFWDVIGRVKWENWNKLGDLGRDEAMHKYIDELKKIMETMAFSGDVQNFLKSVGPFYEFVNLNQPEMHKLKEMIDKYTTSSDSSSSTRSPSVSNSNSQPSTPGTSPDATPAKVIEDNDVAPVTTATSKEPLGETNNNYDHVNSYIPNQKQPQQDHLAVSSTASIIPPPSPMHKPLANGHAKRYSIEDIENDEQDEIIEVEAPETEASTQPARVGSRAISQSSDEEYYSGDSTEGGDQLGNGPIPTVTVTGSSPIKTPKPGTGGTVRKTIRFAKPHHSDTKVTDGYSNKIDAVTVLQSTVDRLNQDIDHVLARLRILEAAYSANPTGVGSRSDGDSSTGGLPGKRLSKMTWIIIFGWPVAVHIILKMISWWLERRRNQGRPGPLAILNL